MAGSAIAALSEEIDVSGAKEDFEKKYRDYMECLDVRLSIT